MKSSHLHPKGKDRGFALVVTLSMMILLTVIAVGLLSLSSISLRKGSTENAGNVARANARLALMIALGELQKAAGPDQRVTADASIYLPTPPTDQPDRTPNKNVLGVWQSWSPRLAEGQATPSPTGTNSYAGKKTGLFQGWLTSSTIPEDLKSTTWGATPNLDNSIELFTYEADGYSQSGSMLNVNLLSRAEKSNSELRKKSGGKEFSGSIAWTIVQENTKAKINVDGPETNRINLTANDQLQAQPRPYLIKSDNFIHPTDDFRNRSTKVLSLAQAKLDTSIWQGNRNSIVEGSDYTTSSMGLLTDTVWGGLKTDINLGFDMLDGNFNQANWGTSPSYKNPFRLGGIRSATPPNMFRQQKPLFRQTLAIGSTDVTLNFARASGTFPLPASIVPTFTTLRSYYRTPNFVYNTAEGPGIFERGLDHVTASTAANTVNSAFPFPGAPPRAQYTQTSYRPVLDRVMYLMSMGVGPDDEVRLIFTPVITLWNPYNVALEIEGAVACPWLDMPFTATWTFNPPQSGEPRSEAMSKIMGNVNPTADGRQIRPYFYAAITPNGGPIGNGQTIAFKPGEVRVFAPASQVDVEYNTAATIPANGSLPVGQTIYMKPVANANDMRNLRGGLAISMKNAKDSNIGFTRKMGPGDSAKVEFTRNGGIDYPFAVTLEDGTRAKPLPPYQRGQAIADVQMVSFANSQIQPLKSPFVPQPQLKSGASRQPFGMIETYHRVGKETRSARRSDIVFTVNPRQPFINKALTDSSFFSAPHYEIVVRPISSFDEALQTANNGRNSFYGQNNFPGANSQLAFFEAPQQSPISLAAFQHADLSGTMFSTAYQIGNSWASPYLDKSRAFASTQSGSAPGGGEASYTRGQMAIYDYSYLANEALWDSFFCSSITHTFEPNGRGSEAAWQGVGIARKSITAETTLSNFLDNPEENPLRNSRMKFFPGKEDIDDLKVDLMRPEGCLRIAAYLQVDGAFNINSTSRKAWIAVLSGLRNARFDVKADNGNTSTTSAALNKTVFPRMRTPMGNDTNFWQGYRSLSDADIEDLADKIIVQVRLRGPFLSLGEFVNRRVDTSTLAYKGALQAAIDNTSLNNAVTDANDTFDTSPYQFKANITKPNNTPSIGVGIPGFLTQADLLQSLAPTITARSDTFTIRGYGEAKDGNGNIIATARCEAVVQRIPEYCDPTDLPDTQIIPASLSDPTPSNLTQINIKFGRKFAIVSFRYLSNNEIASTPTT